MERKDIPITAETVVDRNVSPHLGPVVLSLPEGEALCRDAVSMTCVRAESAAGRQFVVVIAVAEHEGVHLGSLTGMTPDEARNFAASLINSANMVDAGKDLD